MVASAEAGDDAPFAIVYGSGSMMSETTCGRPFSFLAGGLSIVAIHLWMPEKGFVSMCMSSGRRGG